MKKPEDLLRQAGFSKRYQGFRYLVQCVELAAEDDNRLCSLCKEIYGPVAQEHRIPSRSIERDIRTARDYAWENGGRDFFEKISGGKFYTLPTVGELIEILAQYMTEVP